MRRLVILLALPLIAAAPLKLGANPRIFSGHIGGRADKTYSFAANAGETLSATLTSRNTALYFNVVKAGADSALFIGSTSGSHFEGALPATGEYQVLVYLIRAAARRGEAADYMLRLALRGATPDATVAGTPFQATARVACRVGDAPETTCPAGALRQGATTTIVITLPDGATRRLTFRGRTATGSDAAGQGFAAGKDGDLNRIAVGTREHYAFPDAFITGD